MIVKLAFHALKKQKLLYSLITVQIAVVFALCICMVSSITSRFRYYEPFRDVFDGKGAVCHVGNGVLDNHIISDVTQVTERLQNVNFAASQYVPFLETAEEWTEEPTLCSYDAAYLTAYQPPLQSGVWFSGKAAEIEIVISQNSEGISVGDRLIFTDIITGEPVEGLVIGLLQENAKIIDFDRTATGTIDCRSFYQAYSYAFEEHPIVLFSQQQLTGKGVQTQMLDASLLIGYDSEITHQQREENALVLSKMGVDVSFTTEQFRTESLLYIYEQVRILLPIAVGILILTLVSIISVQAVLTKKQLRNYAVYCICGLPWNRMILINLCSAAISTILSFILCLSALSGCRATGLLQNTIISFGGWQFAACGAVVLIVLLFSTLMPTMMLCSTTPNRILKAN